MASEDEDTRSIRVSTPASNGEHPDEASIIDSIVNAKTPPSSTTRIHRVSKMLTETNDYEKYYVPQVVSIGPYHFGKEKLGLVENLKLVFANRLLSNNKETVRILYKKLGEAKMVQELREFYEEKSTDEISDEAFTKMMLLDGCFILYYINSFHLGKVKDYLGLTSHQSVFLHQDLFLLENQIPFKVLDEVMKLVKGTNYWLNMIRRFVDDNILASPRRKRRGWFDVIIRSLWYTKRNEQSSTSDLEGDMKELDHLLQLLQRRLTRKKDMGPPIRNRYTFRNVNELLDVGIDFEPSKDQSFAHIQFSNGILELPPITVDDSTKPMLLNLVAYETCSNVPNESWVTSYICLLDNLIDHPEDVKVLRKAGVLENCLGSDKEVAKLFNEIGTNLVLDGAAYSTARTQIQEHYDSKRNTMMCQLKQEYFKTPWSFLALVGAVLALFLSGVQAYFSVWSPKGECDDLCLYLRKNHHL